ncbi:MAG: 1-(5-phosphoribosyl)-5-[(5-phosphoribosylamino)methylideneamino] imidazole-4-carboxamide isomerase [Candidatus Dormiibacterota bacterium]
MLIVPAIDLLHGRVVRLVQGRYDHVLTYPTSAVSLALEYRDQGASWLHVVDLEGARDGTTRNLATVREIVQATGLRVQVGGGARSAQAIDRLLRAGAQRVVVGTALLERPSTLTRLAARFGERLVVSLDARHGRLLGRGWTAASEVTLLDGAARAVGAGIRRLVYTDTARDGTLAGVEPGELCRLTRMGVPVMAAGGIAAPADLAALRTAGAEAAIIGRALLEGRVDLRSATRACS